MPWVDGDRLTPTNLNTKGGVFVVAADATGASDSAVTLQAALDSGAGLVLLPAGVYAVSQVTIPLGVSLRGAGVSATTILGIGTGSTLKWAVRPLDQAFGDFTVSHSSNTLGTQIAALELASGAVRCAFQRIRVQGLDGVTRYGFLCTGGTTGADDGTEGLFYNVFEQCSGVVPSNSDHSSVFLYWQGADLVGARANGNTALNCHNYGWGTSYLLDNGHSNTWIGCKTEWPEDNDSILSGSHMLRIRSIQSNVIDNVTHDNAVIAMSFENSLTTQRVELYNAGTATAPNFVTFFGCREFDPSSDITLTRDSNTTTSFPHYQAFGGRRNVISERDTATLNSTRRPQLSGEDDSGFWTLRASLNTSAAALLLSGSQFGDATKNAIGPRGSVSLVLNSAATDAEVRMCRSTDGVTHEQLLSVDSSGLLRFGKSTQTQTTVGAAGSAASLPASPTGYLKIQAEGGTTFVMPYYASA